MFFFTLCTRLSFNVFSSNLFRPGLTVALQKIIIKNTPYDLIYSGIFDGFESKFLHSLYSISVQYNL